MQIERSPFYTLLPLRHILLKGLDTQNIGIPMGTRTRTQTNIQKYTFPSLGLGTQNIGIPMGTQTSTQTNIQKYTFPSLGLGMELRKWIHTTGLELAWVPRVPGTRGIFGQ